MTEPVPETRWEPDYTLQAPEGHTWMRQAPEDCPRCGCCTKTLCDTATERGLACSWYVDKEPGTADVSDCPCGRAAEELGFARYYVTKATPEQRARFEQRHDPDKVARVKALVDTLDEHGRPRA